MAGKKKPTTPAPASASSELDWAEVERVLKLMDRHGLEEFEYSNGGFHVRLKKVSSQQSAGVAAAPAAPAAAPAPAPAVSAAPTAAAAPAAPTAEADEKTHVVKSPIVGTFYASPSPGAAAFVKVGDHVQTGQVLCIIEAMKLMNEIESDLGGEVTRVFVENGQPVEYGEPLFAIRPSGTSRSA